MSAVSPRPALAGRSWRLVDASQEAGAGFPYAHVGDGMRRARVTAIGDTADLATQDPVWYVAYASNLSRRRFRAYLEGGRPEGSHREYPGCRDATPPSDSRAMWRSGALWFAGTSTVWAGGLAFYDPSAEGVVATRAYLVSFGQFSDVVAQEARLEGGADLVRDDDGRLVALSSVYDMILELEPYDGTPAMTMTARTGSTGTPVAPSAAYLTTILAGLADGFGLDPEAQVEYLLHARGVVPTWNRAGLLALIGADPAARHPSSTSR